VKRTLKMEFGFRTVRPGIHTEFAPPSEETRAESITLTGDLNVAVVEWTVQFRIQESPRRHAPPHLPRDDGPAPAQARPQADPRR
jgi:hypothetical protein